MEKRNIFPFIHVRGRSDTDFYSEKTLLDSVNSSIDIFKDSFSQKKYINKRNNINNRSLFLKIENRYNLPTNKNKLVITKNRNDDLFSIFKKVFLFKKQLDQFFFKYKIKNQKYQTDNEIQMISKVLKEYKNSLISSNQKIEKSPLIEKLKYYSDVVTSILETKPEEYYKEIKVAIVEQLQKNGTEIIKYLEKISNNNINDDFTKESSDTFNTYETRTSRNYFLNYQIDDCSKILLDKKNEIIYLISSATQYLLFSLSKITYIVDYYGIIVSILFEILCKGIVTYIENDSLININNFSEEKITTNNSKDAKELYLLHLIEHIINLSRIFILSMKKANYSNVSTTFSSLSKYVLDNFNELVPKCQGMEKIFEVYKNSCKNTEGLTSKINNYLSISTCKIQKLKMEYIFFKKYFKNFMNIDNNKKLEKIFRAFYNSKFIYWRSIYIKLEDNKQKDICCRVCEQKIPLNEFILHVNYCKEQKNFYEKIFENAQLINKYLNELENYHINMTQNLLTPKNNLFIKDSQLNYILKKLYDTKLEKLSYQKSAKKNIIANYSAKLDKVDFLNSLIQIYKTEKDKPLDYYETKPEELTHLLSLTFMSFFIYISNKNSEIVDQKISKIFGSFLCSLIKNSINAEILLILKECKTKSNTYSSDGFNKFLESVKTTKPKIIIEKPKLIYFSRRDNINKDKSKKATIGILDFRTSIGTKKQLKNEKATLKKNKSPIKKINTNNFRNYIKQFKMNLSLNRSMNLKKLNKQTLLQKTEQNIKDIIHKKREKLLDNLINSNKINVSGKLFLLDRSYYNLNNDDSYLSYINTHHNQSFSIYNNSNNICNSFQCIDKKNGHLRTQTNYLGLKRVNFFKKKDINLLSNSVNFSLQKLDDRGKKNLSVSTSKKIKLKKISSLNCGSSFKISQDISEQNLSCLDLSNPEFEEINNFNSLEMSNKINEKNKYNSIDNYRGYSFLSSDYESSDELKNNLRKKNKSYFTGPENSRNSNKFIKRAIGPRNMKNDIKLSLFNAQSFNEKEDQGNKKCKKSKINNNIISEGEKNSSDFGNDDKEDSLISIIQFEDNEEEKDTKEDEFSLFSKNFEKVKQKKLNRIVDENEFIIEENKYIPNSTKNVKINLIFNIDKEIEEDSYIDFDDNFYYFNNDENHFKYYLKIANILDELENNQINKTEINNSNITPFKGKLPEAIPFLKTNNKISNDDVGLFTKLINEIYEESKINNTKLNLNTSRNTKNNNNISNQKNDLEKNDISITSKGSLNSSNISNANINECPIVHRRQKISNFELIFPIAKGGYGSVSLYKKKTTGDIYAIKSVDINSIKEKKLSSTLKNEQNILMEINSDFIVSSYFIFKDKKNYYFVMEYLPGGDVFTLLSKIILPIQTIKLIIAETLLATHYLHKINIIHHDIKPENILITKEGHFKLSDFGLSKTINSNIDDQNSDTEIENNDDSNNAVGTLNYMAPELFTDEYPISFEIDYWAIGVVIYELFTYKLPFEADTQEETRDNIIDYKINWDNIYNDEIKKNYQKYLDDGVDLIKKFLVVNPKERWGDKNFDEIKKHNFFKDFNWDGIRNIKCCKQVFPYLKKKIEETNEKIKKSNEKNKKFKNDKNKNSKNSSVKEITFYDLSEESDSEEEEDVGCIERLDNLNKRNKELIKMKFKKKQFKIDDQRNDSFIIDLK